MKGGNPFGGPPPDPNALRRAHDAGTWMDLPAEGRAGPTPIWPLSRATRRELALWTIEWRRPQAVVWERNDQTVEVALYVRSLVAAERPTASVAHRTLVRQQQEALGLSLPGMLRLRWRLAGAAVVEQRPTGTETASAKSRFRIVGSRG